MTIAEFLLFVLTATLGGMFLCGANDLITIFVAPECYYKIFTHGWSQLFYFGSWFLLAIWFTWGRYRASRNSEWSYQYTNV
ncbi:hypothetical protein Gotur_002612 [Gossypium turneri]